MGKALLGAHMDTSTVRLLDEVRALRERVAELEAALEAAQEVRATRERDASEADREPAPTI